MKKQAIALFLDMEKDFDSIEFSYMISLLTIMNFGPNFQNAIKGIYHKFIASLNINNITSPNILLGRGM